MGLFGSSKKTYVSSVAYNLAGDIKDRPDYLKTLVAGHILEQPKNTVTRTMLDSYLGGPGINLRRFGRWAREYGYNANMGIVSSSLSLAPTIDTDALTAELASIFGTEIYVNEAQIGTADYGMWATQYMLANHADLYLSQWSADFDESTEEIILNLPETAPIRFSPVGFSKYGRFLYVSLNQEKEASSSSEITAWKDGSGPSLDGYTLAHSEVIPTPVELINTVHVEQTVEGNDPVSQDYVTPTTVDASIETSIYTRIGNLPDAPSSLVIGDVTYSVEFRERYEIVVVDTEDTLVDEYLGQTRTTVVTKSEQVLKKVKQYRTSKVTVRERSWDNEQVFIYRQGTGNATLDSFFVGSTSAGTFYPSIPLRINNKFVTEPGYEHMLPWVKKAIRRSTNQSMESLIEMVSDNPSLKDIDYAYMVFGASLNTPENTAKRYLFEFFRGVAAQDGGVAMAKFWQDYEAAVASWDAWKKWYETGRYTNDFSYGGHSGGAVTEPVRLPMPTPPKQNISITSGQNYNINIALSGATETTHLGKYIPSAKIGDLRIIKGTSIVLQAFPEQDSSFGRAAQSMFSRMNVDKLESIIIEWQVEENTFRRMTVYDLVHTNKIYGGKSVTITAWQALDDNEESGFIVPLQEGILRAMPIPVATQLCTASTYMVFNCYQVVKKKWYQTGLFKVIVVIIIIIVSIFFPPAGGAAAGGGVLGANAAVGASLGFSGTAAIVAGAIVNAIAAMIVTQVITSASRTILGEKVGSIIGAIASVIAITVGGGMANGQSSAAAFGNLMSAENLLMLTSALSDGISQYINASTKDIQQQTMNVLSDYQEAAQEIAEKFLAEFGGGGIIDPIRVAKIDAFRLEAPDTFMTRTLMTGTDIADMSHDMLDNFTDLTLVTRLE